MKRALILAITLLAGCDLYWHGSGDDVVCAGGGGISSAPEFESRNPDTGVCEYQDDGDGDGGCDGVDSEGCCIPTETGGTAERAEAYCSGACEDLDETSCLATAGCHAAYAPLSLPPDGGSNGAVPATFVSCWDIQPLVPIEGGGCAGLDSFTCGEHDDCISVLDGFPESDAPNGFFSSCADETPVTPPDSCDGVDCGAGATCEQQCYPCDPSDGSNGCMSSCGPVCVPTETCDTVSCGSGYACAETCDASSNNCAPTCVPTTTCESQATEAACEGRSDCTPVYTGTMCTCTEDDGCTCLTETYARCESLGMPGSASN